MASKDFQKLKSILNAYVNQSDKTTDIRSKFNSRQNALDISPTAFTNELSKFKGTNNNPLYFWINHKDPDKRLTGWSIHKFVLEIVDKYTGYIPIDKKEDLNKLKRGDRVPLYYKQYKLLIYPGISGLQTLRNRLIKEAETYKHPGVSLYFGHDRIGSVAIGHNFGPGLSSWTEEFEVNGKKYSLIELLDEEGKPTSAHEIKNLGKNKIGILKELEDAAPKLKIKTKIDKLKSLFVEGYTGDAEVVLERRIKDKDLYLVLTISKLEDWEKNSETGSELGTVNSRRNNLLKEIIAKIDLFNQKGSKSGKELFDDLISDAFYDKPLKNVGVITKTKVRLSQKGKTLPTNKLSAAKFSKAIKPKSFKDSKSTSMQDLNNANTLSAVNNRLHDQIQKNMGKGRAKQILNYRTGRFARSVELESLVLSKTGKTAEARVKYMQYPYGVFEPGGRLHLPGRDPHRIIGKSIRQILQEQQIANLARVGVQLHG